VSLSATITAVGTLLCLVSIPFWLKFLSGSSTLDPALMYLSATKIIAQLIALMILPLILGMILARAFPRAIERRNVVFRLASFVIIVSLLLATVWAVRDQALTLAGDVVLAAASFILGAMLLGHVLGYGMKPEERPVLVIESERDVANIVDGGARRKMSQLCELQHLILKRAGLRGEPNQPAHY